MITLFPELFSPFASVSMVGRAVESSALELALVDLRPFGIGKHRTVDDTPYGGGSGMVLRVDTMVSAIESVDPSAPDLGPARKVLLTPQGRRFDQRMAEDLVQNKHLVLICGRYEGFDERIRHFVDDEVSLGDFIMTGGEVAAMAMIEALVRLLPGVLGNDVSALSESFSPNLAFGLEHPQFTRPVSYRGHDVPAVLVGGNHQAIDAWRRREAEQRTLKRRPDLISSTTSKTR